MQPSDEAPLRKVYLYGHLALQIGKCLELAFRTPADCVRLIELNWPGFAKRFKSGLFHLTVEREGGERELDAEHLSIGFTGEALHIMPRAIGKGKGKSILTALVGGLVIGAAFFFSGGTLGVALPGLLGATGATYGTIATFGLGLVMSGVGSLLSPTMKTPKADGGLKSAIFNGPVNIAEQGGPVPLVFGKMMIGSTVISASLDVENDPTENDQRALSPALHFNESNGQTGGRLNMSDLIENTQGAVLTRLNGVATNATGTMTILNEFAIDYSRAGVSYTPGGATGGDTRYPPRIYHIRIRWSGSANRSIRIPFEVTQGGRVYSGNIEVTTQNFADDWTSGDR